jgi:hypothetical protein
LDRDDALRCVVVDDVAIEERHAGVDLRGFLHLFVMMRLKFVKFPASNEATTVPSVVAAAITG